MTGPINDILIVGGGTAGWLAAAYLAKQLGTSRPDGVKITLIESSTIPTVGVGEGTFPTMRLTLAALGIEEAEFMRESAATFKQGFKFVDWVDAPVGDEHRYYYHPFDVPHTMERGGDLTPYWLLGVGGDTPYGDAVTLQNSVCKADRAPKRLDDAQYRGPINYAYHIDAGKFAVFLKRIATGFGVKHLVGTIDKVNLDETGAIESLVAPEHGTLKAGLYIDCTGFAGLLIGKALQEPMKDISRFLFADHALAINVPYAAPDTPIASATLATAHEAGWTWDIGLGTRRGVGYSYSSHHTTHERAEEILRAYVGPQAKGLDTLRIRMRVGYRKEQWKKNCVAIGLSGGFLEPLESTGIILIENAIRLVADYFPRSGDLDAVAKVFNHTMTTRYDRCIDFVKMHFSLTRRTDNDFWRDNANPASLPDSLRAMLEVWKYRSPSHVDMGTVYDTFGVPSYKFVLYGMGFVSDLSANKSAYPHVDEARKEFSRVKAAERQAIAALPDHRAAIEHICKHGFLPTDMSRPSAKTPLPDVIAR